MDLTIAEYQKYVSNGVADREYLGKPTDADAMCLEMVGELGEVLNAYKHARKWPDPLSTEEAHLGEELGDLLWYVFAVCTVLGFNVQDVVKNNMAKLNERYGRGNECE